MANNFDFNAPKDNTPAANGYARILFFPYGSLVVVLNCSSVTTYMSIILVVKELLL
jgi:hypothetical protein